jgi:hypothetical protein
MSNQNCTLYPPGSGYINPQFGSTKSMIYGCGDYTARGGNNAPCVQSGGAMQKNDYGLQGGTRAGGRMFYSVDKITPLQSRDFANGHAPVLRHNNGYCGTGGGSKKKSRSKHRSKRRKHFHKGTRSTSRKGRLDFFTNKKSKKYTEKVFKKLFGKKTINAPEFSFLKGGNRKHPKKRHHSRTRKGRLDFVTHAGDNLYNRLGHRQKGKHKPFKFHRSRKNRQKYRHNLLKKFKKQKGGANILDSKSYGFEGDALTPSEIGLASPTPHTIYQKC